MPADLADFRPCRTLPLAIAAATVLAGCVATVDKVPQERDVAPPPQLAVRKVDPGAARPRPRPPKTDGAAAGRSSDDRSADGKSIDPQSLVGDAPEQVEQLLGAPTETTARTPGLVWTYRAAGCALTMVFYPDVKTKEYQLLTYDLKADPGENDACYRKLAAKGG